MDRIEINMTKLTFLSLTLLLCMQSQSNAENSSHIKTDTPIIGVLAQEIARSLNTIWPGEYKSYIAASYVKFIEGGGARVVPIWIGEERPYYEKILSKLNGVLLPGGGTFFNNSNGYAAAGKHIYDIATEMNDNGKYFPLFGTCLGFELLLYASINQREYRAKCSSQQQALALKFAKNFQYSHMYGSAPSNILHILKTEPVTANFHSYCVTKQNLNGFGLNEMWKVLSYNNDVHGLKFISSVEHKRYPYYGVQFHPEKNLYEWVPNRNIPHTEGAIAIAQYFQSFVVNECRKSNNRFASTAEENQVLIYNFPATFTALYNSTFTQSYLFEANIQYPTNHRESNNTNEIPEDNF